MDNEGVLIVMKNIIEGYLNSDYDADESVERLIRNVDIEKIYDERTELIVTDCYFSIKHLTEEGYETCKAELLYFKDCINGIRKYDMNEKCELLKGEIHYPSQR